MIAYEERAIASAPGYRISNMGDVVSPRGAVLKPASNGKYGYRYVQMTRANWGYVHRLVAEAFIGPVLGMDVEHINGDTSDNRAANLLVVTHAENMAMQRNRKPRCLRGHEFSEFGKLTPSGKRRCLRCERIRDRRRRGKGDPGEWYVTMTGDTFASLIGGAV